MSTYFHDLKNLNEAQLLELADFAITAERYGSFDPLLPSYGVPEAWLEVIKIADQSERFALIKECIDLIQQKTSFNRESKNKPKN